MASSTCRPLRETASARHDSRPTGWSSSLSDGHPDYPAKVGENLALSLGGTDKPRLTRIFNALGEGGRVNLPLAKQPLGGQVGWLVDKFGISWTVNIQEG